MNHGVAPSTQNKAGHPWPTLKYGFTNNERGMPTMCSIFGMFDLQPGDDLAALRRQALELSQRQRHRGPDWSGVFV
ncbi:MAG: hypothetical protein KGK04_15205, partial [Xanthomonadaceae bacterium]|nr:hypothetical protein [Xanthomonadaceae bacterium]